MAKFLIEVPHEAGVVACARVVDVFLKSGSHWVTNAEWGCKDGDHKAWMIMEADSREEARQVVPPAFRSQARIIELNRFSMEEIDNILGRHQQ